MRIRRGIAATSIALALGAAGSAEGPAPSPDRDSGGKPRSSCGSTRCGQITACHGSGSRRELRRAAEQHARNMARYGYFSHSWSNGARFGTWIAGFWPGPGFTSWSAGENLYWAAPDATAARVVRGWMRRPRAPGRHPAGRNGRESASGSFTFEARSARIAALGPSRSRRRSSATARSWVAAHIAGALSGSRSVELAAWRRRRSCSPGTARRTGTPWGAGRVTRTGR